MHFTDKLKVVVDKQDKKVRLSVIINEDNVIVHLFDLSEFQNMINQFEAQK